jgi:hypothetical protein
MVPVAPTALALKVTVTVARLVVVVVGGGGKKTMGALAVVVVEVGVLEVVVGVVVEVVGVVGGTSPSSITVTADPFAVPPSPAAETSKV